jgi:hypothetical protein
MKKVISIVLALVITGVLLAGCADADVVLKYSPGSLDAITKAFPDIVKPADMETHYAPLTVDGVTSLIVSHDYSKTGKDDIMIETPLKPFTDAGLDTSKLGAGYKVEGDKFYLTGDYGDGSGLKDNIRDSLFEAVKADRKVLTYHQALDHYGIKLPQGKFEWAKDYTKNDKDIVFVIAAKPLADIGVNVQNVEGWIFKTMQDENGNNVDVLLKPYDLK